jgi:ankyrin repeat protein
MMICNRILTVTLTCLLLLPITAFSQTLDDARTAIRTHEYESAITIYTDLAQSGNPDAAYLLASMYRVGRGVDKDLELANEWMQKAANAGHARAQYNMGQLSLSDKESQEEARAWFDKAALQGHVMAAESLKALDQPTGLVIGDMTVEQRNKALNQASRQGETELVRSLLGDDWEEPASPTGQRTALLEAITAGHADIVMLLLDNGANPNGIIPNEGIVQGRTIPLHCAVRTENPSIVSSLLAAGANMDSRDEAGNTALIIAATKGSNDMVKTLLAGGARTGPTDNREWTALTATRQKNHLETEQILLDAGATDPLNTAEEQSKSEVTLTPDVEKQAGWTPLMYAAWRGELQAVKQILHTRPDVDATDIDGHTALSRAAWRGHVEIVNELLAAGSDPNMRQNNGFTPLLWATQDGHVEVMRSLVAANASLYDFIPATGYSPLLLAYSCQDMKATGLLLSLGADINWRSPTGESALMVAAAGESNELLQQTLIDGVDLEASDERGRTAIWYAINSGREQNLAALLDHGANAEVQETSNQHPLIQAIRMEDPIAVQTLLQHGVNPDVKSSSENSALIVAATIGNTTLMRLLLDAGAATDFQNQVGQTALIRATIAGQRDAVALLLEVDADTRLVDRDHKTARDWAKETGHVNSLALLDEHRDR